MSIELNTTPTITERVMTGKVAAAIVAGELGPTGGVR